MILPFLRESVSVISNSIITTKLIGIFEVLIYCDTCNITGVIGSE